MAINDITAMMSEQMRRIMDAEGEDAIRLEASRGDAVAKLGAQCIAADRLTLDVFKFRNEVVGDRMVYEKTTKMLGDGNA